MRRRTPYPFDHEFVVFFPAGISTTAGHDSLYEQSYPIVLNGTMGRLMAAAGVRYEAINVAMGNTRVAPYSLCVDAHAGLQADIISWDMVRCTRRASVRLAKTLTPLRARSVVLCLAGEPIVPPLGF